MENMIAMPITKRTEIVMGIQVCLISWINLDYKENGGKKAFLANPNHQHHVSQCGEYDCHTNNKRNGDCYKHPSLSHFTMNFDHEENGGKKAFFANPMHQYSASQYGEHDCPANNKKNTNDYGYQSLSHFTNEL